jgi:hypothetical protein
MRGTRVGCGQGPGGLSHVFWHRAQVPHLRMLFAVSSPAHVGAGGRGGRGGGGQGGGGRGSKQRARGGGRVDAGTRENGGEKSTARGGSEGGGGISGTVRWCCFPRQWSCIGPLEFVNLVYIRNTISICGAFDRVLTDSAFVRRISGGYRRGGFGGVGHFGMWKEGPVLVSAWTSV